MGEFQRFRALLWAHWEGYMTGSLAVALILALGGIFWQGLAYLSLFFVVLLACLLLAAYRVWRDEYHRFQERDQEAGVVETKIREETAAKETALRQEIGSLVAQIQARTDYQSIIKRLAELRDKGNALLRELENTPPSFPVTSCRGAAALWRQEVLVYLEANAPEKEAVFNERGHFDETKSSPDGEREALQKYIGWHVDQLAEMVRQLGSR